jgi:hypothetical protein
MIIDSADDTGRREKTREEKMMSEMAPVGRGVDGRRGGRGEGRRGEEGRRPREVK